MSTRGVIGFTVDGVDHIAYNHSDSYPSHLGLVMVSFVRSVDDWDEVREYARKLEDVTNREPTLAEIERFEGLTNLNVSTQTEHDWYCLLHEAQGNPGWMLQAGVYEDYRSFLADSLFCEWAYIVNLDTGMLEIYQGFQDKPHTNGRFADMPIEEYGTGSTYYPVALVREFPFDAIPHDWEQQVDMENDEYA